MFEFDVNPQDMDSRAIFANRVCKLIYQQYENYIKLIVKEIKPFYNDFEEHVRNVYELIPKQIPLFAYIHLKECGAEGLSMSESEYNKAIESTLNACKYFYSKDGYISLEFAKLLKSKGYVEPCCKFYMDVVGLENPEINNTNLACNHNKFNLSAPPFCDAIEWLHSSENQY